jgi:hypothetical protein
MADAEMSGNSSTTVERRHTKGATFTGKLNRIAKRLRGEAEEVCS